MVRSHLKIGCFLFLLFGVFALRAQKDKDIIINVGDTELSVGEDFVIRIQFKNIEGSFNLPQLSGFKNKGGNVISRNSSTSIINGSVSKSSNVIYEQRYQALNEGVFKLKSFKISVGGVTKVHPEVTIKVKALPKLTSENLGSYLSLEASESEVYVGEPLKITLSFIYTEEEYQSIRMDNNFHEQIEGLKKEIVDPSFWIEEIEKGTKAKVFQQADGGRVLRDVLYEVVVIPQKEQDISIDSLSMTVLQLLNVNGRQKWYRLPYKSNAIKVSVKPLPEHPLKGKVPIGVFTLREEIGDSEVLEGDNVEYLFQVSGEGNLATLLDPITKSNDSIMVFKEADRLEYSNDTGNVAGSKIFKYNMVPEVAGLYKVKDVIFFPYFNSSTGQYDTLKSRKVIQVNSNPKRKTSHKSMNEVNEDEFELSLDDLDEELVPIGTTQNLNYGILLVLLLILCALILLLFKKTNRKEGKDLIQ